MFILLYNERFPPTRMQCVKVLMSLLWWMDNEVYWINYGCQRNVNNNWAWVSAVLFIMYMLF
jgi:hypothetical protein